MGDQGQVVDQATKRSLSPFPEHSDRVAEPALHAAEFIPHRLNRSQDGDFLKVRDRLSNRSGFG